MNTVRRLLAQTCATASLIAATALPAQAAFIYTLDVVPAAFGGHGDFTLTLNQILTTDTTFQLSEFDFIDPLVGTTSVTFDFGLVSPDDVQVIFQGPGVGVFWDYAGALRSPGSYCAGFANTCAGKAGVMTITETTRVPEPAPLALLGAAIAAATLLRRRQAARG